ncbi:MAG: hypothetical protein LBI20_02715 [Holosporales bacterium]|jgi:hypothetical protein|nr:hypothetical protein [Holosporales bacterium]
MKKIILGTLILASITISNNAEAGFEIKLTDKQREAAEAFLTKLQTELYQNLGNASYMQEIIESLRSWPGAIKGNSKYILNIAGGGISGVIAGLGFGWLASKALVSTEPEIKHSRLICLLSGGLIGAGSGLYQGYKTSLARYKRNFQRLTLLAGWGGASISPPIH